MTTSIINTIFAGALLLGAATPASADRVFPPPHLSPDAEFDVGTVTEQVIRDAWCHEDESDRRASLRDNEARGPSPYPSMYYFVKVRYYANEESEKFKNNRSRDPRDVITIVDQKQSAHDRS